MKRGSPLRRVSAQTGSKERLERVLDAAEHELGEVGYEAATMQSIANRAETSIGSLYQFFPTNMVLFDAIADRYLERVRQMLDVLLAPEQLAMPWTKFLELAVDEVELRFSRCLRRHGYLEEGAEGQALPLVG